MTQPTFFTTPPQPPNTRAEVPPLRGLIARPQQLNGTLYSKKPYLCEERPSGLFVILI